MVVRARETNEEIEAIGYIRQSDQRQDKEDISELTQLRKIEQFCEFNNFKLVKVFKDIDYSGFRIKYTKRPGLMDALKCIEDRPRVRKMVFFNLSRLTRLKKDFQELQGILNSHQVDICSASESVDFSTPNGRLVAGFFVDLNEYYSDNLSEIVNDSKETNAKKGRWNGGPAPFGFVKTVDGLGFEEVPERAYYVREIFRMAKLGKGPYLIARWLNEQKVYSLTGKEWTARRVRYMLTNPTYAAMQRWKGECYKLLVCPVLVSWDDFNYIQSTLFGKDKAWKGKERQLLTSVLICPECGSKMHSRYMSHSKQKRKYVCSRKTSMGTISCSSPNHDQESFEAAVINLIANMAEKKYGYESLIPEMKEDSDNNNSFSKLQDELANINNAEQKIFDDYYLHNKIEEHHYELSMRRYGKRKAEILELLDKIPLPQSKSFGDYNDAIQEFSELINELPDDDKRRSIELLVEKITPGSPAVVHFKWGETREIHPRSIEKFKKKLILY
ncbi:hypothetical protein BK129_14580 [Paenibacillus amylolyticus]|uniref:recombinase family protein n=1 Tax=Paenibacillus TaxID=44249 RepID=UPI00096F8B99|nr:recombinase family protein [Paenibacillus amylolyticus]OMF05210.1 hypothetical protein BK129_14580 [Paenibacillus amylolyticus]